MMWKSIFSQISFRLARKKLEGLEINSPETTLARVPLGKSLGIQGMCMSQYVQSLYRERGTVRCNLL